MVAPEPSGSAAPIQATFSISPRFWRIGPCASANMVVLSPRLCQLRMDKEGLYHAC